MSGSNAREDARVGGRDTGYYAAAAGPDVRAKLDLLAAIVEFHADGVDYPTRVLDRHRLVRHDQIFLGQHVQVLAGHLDRAVVRLAFCCVTDAFDVAVEVRVLTITRDHGAIGGDRQLRFVRIAEGDQRRVEFGGVIVRKVLREPGRQPLLHASLGVEAYRLEILDIEVGIVAARTVEFLGPDLNLCVQPVGEHGERAEQQHRRPRDEPIKHCGPEFHWLYALSRDSSSPCADRMSSQSSRTAPLPPCARVT